MADHAAGLAKDAAVSSSDPENGTRATVALVNSKVETVDAKVDGLRDLVVSEFAQLKGLPVAVAALTERVLHAETRITYMERQDDVRQGWRKVTLPQILIGLVMAAISILNIVVLSNAH